MSDRSGKIAREVLLANIGIKASWNSRDGERVDAGFCDSVADALRAEYQRGYAEGLEDAAEVMMECTSGCAKHHVERIRALKPKEEE